jgi:hypothetical protein
MTEEQEDIIEGESQETDKEPDIEIITRSDDEEVFRVMDQADEEMVLAELEGRAEALDHYVYSFVDRSGKTISGLSLSGTREAARALALASLTNTSMIQPTMPDPPTVIQETKEFIRVQCTALDQRTGFRWHGFVEESKIYLDRETGEPKEKAFTFVIAMSKAQRNALRGMLPEHWIIKMIERFIGQGKVRDLSLARGGSESAFPKGKHKGKTIQEVYEEDPQYLTWCSENWTDRWGEAIRRFLAAKEPKEEGNLITVGGKKYPADGKISQEWFERLRQRISEAGMVDVHVKNHLKKHYNVERINDLTYAQAMAFGKHLKELKTQKPEEQKPPEDDPSRELTEEDGEPYAIPQDILDEAKEIEFDIGDFVALHISPDTVIDEAVQGLLRKVVQGLKAGGNVEALGENFNKQLVGLKK